MKNGKQSVLPKAGTYVSVANKGTNDLYCILLKIWIFIYNYYRPYLYVSDNFVNFEEKSFR